jgi:NTP pyrophosphatase (non-canonical NTP hydrolase)
VTSEIIDLQKVSEYLAKFADDRDWVQYHSPKNLAMALAVEAGELLEIFQWLTSEQSHELKDADRLSVGQELADVLQYLIRIADVLDIDLNAALWEKLKLNESRFSPGP